METSSQMVAAGRRLQELGSHMQLMQVSPAAAAGASRRGAPPEEIGLGGGRLVDEATLRAVTVEHLMVPMRDGTRISAYVFRPPGDGPWHALLQQVNTTTLSTVQQEAGVLY